MKIDQQAAACISNRLRIDKRPAPQNPSAVKDNDDTCKPPPLTTRHRSIAVPFLQTEADSFTQCVRQQEQRSRIPMSSTAGCGVTLHLSHKS